MPKTPPTPPEPQFDSELAPAELTDAELKLLGLD